jgi:hypothetical protein
MGRTGRGASRLANTLHFLADRRRTPSGDLAYRADRRWVGMSMPLLCVACRLPRASQGARLSRKRVLVGEQAAACVDLAPAQRGRRLVLKPAPHLRPLPDAVVHDIPGLIQREAWIERPTRAGKSNLGAQLLGHCRTKDAPAPQPPPSRARVGRRRCVVQRSRWGGYQGAALLLCVVEPFMQELIERHQGRRPATDVVKDLCQRLHCPFTGRWSHGHRVVIRRDGSAQPGVAGSDRTRRGCRGDDTVAPISAQPGKRPTASAHPSTHNAEPSARD